MNDRLLKYRDDFIVPSYAAKPRESSRGSCKRMLVNAR